MDLLDLHECLLAQRVRACPGTTTNEQLLNGNLRANSALAYQRRPTSIWAGPSPFFAIQSDAGFDLDQLLPKENQTARICAGLGRFGQEIEGCGFA
jgi:hypothetical protein